MPGKGVTETTNTVGAVVTLLIFALIILVFVSRLAGSARAERGLGLALIALAVPLLGLLVASRGGGRGALYVVQLGLMVAYLVAELLLDYVFRVDFRSVRWMVIGYVTLFFAATGGMLGVASQAGKVWMYSSIVLFLVMAVLAFVQRAVTGM
jgi:hypothetical protein